MLSSCCFNLSVHVLNIPICTVDVLLLSHLLLQVNFAINVLIVRKLIDKFLQMPRYFVLVHFYLIRFIVACLNIIYYEYLRVCVYYVETTKERTSHDYNDLEYTPVLWEQLEQSLDSLVCLFAL